MLSVVDCPNKKNGEPAKRRRREITSSTLESLPSGERDAFAALLGAHMLKEGDVTRRTIAAVGMVLGISALALG